MRRRDQVDVDVHARAQARLGADVHGDLDRARLGIDDRGDALDRAGVIETGGGLGRHLGRKTGPQLREVLLGHVDARHDRVEVDHVEQLLADLDLVAEVDHARRDGAGDRGADLGVAQLALGVGQRDAELLELVALVVELFLADQFLVVEALLANELAFRLGDLALDLRQRTGLLVVLQAKQDLAAANVVAFLYP